MPAAAGCIKGTTRQGPCQPITRLMLHFSMYSALSSCGGGVWWGGEACARVCPCAFVREPEHQWQLRGCGWPRSPGHRVWEGAAGPLGAERQGQAAGQRTCTHTGCKNQGTQNMYPHPHMPTRTVGSPYAPRCSRCT